MLGLSLVTTLYFPLWHYVPTRIGFIDKYFKVKLSKRLKKKIQVFRPETHG